MCDMCVFMLFVVLVFASPGGAVFLVIPEDVATGFAAIYGFSPRLLLGNDHRFGFGFRFGNHADLQLLYEIGPQLTTRPIQPKIRSVSYRQRAGRRQPLLDFLLRTGLIKEAEYQPECDEPR